MESPSESAGGLRDELRDDAQTMTDTAKQRLHSEVDARKGGAVEQVKSLSSALGSAANQLGGNSPSWMKSAFEQGAQQLQRLADTFEQKDSRQLSREVQQLAAQNPGTFLAGCALAGFAAARVFRAGASGASSSGSMSTAPSVYDPMAAGTAGHQSATSQWSPSASAGDASLTKASLT
jgi:hypothetical protein